MIATSDSWKRVLATSHVIHPWVEVDGRRVPHSGGTVVLDADSEGYGSLQFDLAVPSDLADTEDAPILPFGSRARCGFDLELPDGTMETVAVNCDFLLTVTPTQAGVLSARQVSCGTTVVLVKDDRFLVPYNPSSTSAKATLTALLSASVSGATVTYDAAVTDRTITQDTVYERERWEAVAALLDTLSSRLRPVAGGFRVLRSDVAVKATPDWSVAHGQNLLAGTVPATARDDRYNAVVAFNADDPTVYAVSKITDPASPVRWDGPFGHRPLFYASPMLTAATVQQAADTRLAGLAGRARVVEVEAIANPALEPNDTVRMRWPDGSTEDCVVVKVEFPLVPGPMKLTLRGSG